MWCASSTQTRLRQRSMTLSRVRYKLSAFALALVVASIHLGRDEFLSVQFLTFFLAAAIVSMSVWRRPVAMSGVIGPLILAVVASWGFGGHDEHLVLRGLRSAVVLLVLVEWQRRVPSFSIAGREIAHSALRIACVFSLVLATLQLGDSLTVNRGLFDVPPSLYALDYGTLFGDRRTELSSAGYFIRPSALFSEPSALAALGVLGALVSYHRGDPWLRVISVLLVAVSMSLSGLIFVGLIILVKSGSRRERRSVLLLAISLAVASFLLLGDRIGGVVAGTDMSARIRLFEPLSVIVSMVSEQLFFGAHPDRLLGFASSDVYTIFDNWILNQFLLYGLLGFLWIAAPFIFLHRRIWLLLASYMVANGDLFYYDRAVFLLLGIVATHAGRKLSNDYDRNYCV